MSAADNKPPGRTRCYLFSAFLHYTTIQSECSEWPLYYDHQHADWHAHQSHLPLAEPSGPLLSEAMPRIPTSQVVAKTMQLGTRGLQSTHCPTTQFRPTMQSLHCGMVGRRLLPTLKVTWKTMCPRTWRGIMRIWIIGMISCTTILLMGVKWKTGNGRTNRVDISMGLNGVVLDS